MDYLKYQVSGTRHNGRYQSKKPVSGFRAHVFNQKQQQLDGLNAEKVSHLTEDAANLKHNLEPICADVTNARKLQCPAHVEA